MHTADNDRCPGGMYQIERRKKKLNRKDIGEVAKINLSTYGQVKNGYYVYLLYIKRVSNYRYMSYY